MVRRKVVVGSEGGCNGGDWGVRIKVCGDAWEW